MDSRLYQPNDPHFYDEDAFAAARAVFYENRQRFIDRLACAQYFDSKRFDGMLHGLEVLRQFHKANAEPIQASYFADAQIITNHLQIQSHYSKKQRDECSVALARWQRVLHEFGRDGGEIQTG